MKISHGIVLALALVACKQSSGAKEKDVPGDPLFAGAGSASKPQVHETRINFTDVSAAWGLAVKHHAGRSKDKYIPENMTGGVVIDDFDRNGALDLLVIDAGSIVGPPAEGFGSKLFLGDGKGGFRDATKEWGLSVGSYAMGAVAGDLDGDGWTDVFVTRVGAPDIAFRNNGGKGFVDVTAQWGIGGDGGWSTSAGVFDLENDGDLDLFVARYVEFDPATAIKCYLYQVQVSCTPRLYTALPDRLFRNDGKTFTDVGPTVLAGASPGKGLALSVADLDGDGLVDVYVANDTTPNHLWRNKGGGKLEEVGSPIGVAYSELGAEEASMGVDVSDANDDGRWDLAVTNFQAETTDLYVQDEGFFFEEQSDRSGIGASARAHLKFGIDFFDADNDGDEDLMVANGHLYDNIESFRGAVSFAQANTLYEAVGGGKFVDVSASAGPALADKQVSRGLATGDLDGDGDLDFVVGNNDGTLQVGRNDTKGGGFVDLWLEGVKASRTAVGALVTAKIGDRTVRRQITGSESFLSQSSRHVHIGLGTAQRADQITIRWPGDPTPQDLGAVAGGQFLHVLQGQAPVPYKPGEKVIAP